MSFLSDEQNYLLRKTSTLKKYSIFCVDSILEMKDRMKIAIKAEVYLKLKRLFKVRAILHLFV